MATSRQLSEDDSCRRMAHYSARWTPPAISPREILRKSIDHGLLSEEDDPGQAAADHAMELATSTTIDTAETDLLGLASHISGLADFLTWVLRAEAAPWEHPLCRGLPEGQVWESGVFLGDSGLRGVALVDRLDAMTEMSLRNSWGVQGECAVYDDPMSLIVVEIGALRAGKWANPFTVGYRHPQARTLRFRKRDGESFGANWERVGREDDEATREEWLDAMTEDGVLAEAIHVLAIEVPERRHAIISLAEGKLRRMALEELPEPQLSRCFDKLRLCPFRGCCPQGLEPSEVLGFYSIARLA